MSTVTEPESQARPSGHARRYATRYEPARRDACLSWWEASPEPDQGETNPEAPADDQAQHLFALLLDISHTGASLATDRIPQAKAGVWLRLDGESCDDWTEAEVVGVTTTIRGPHLLRLAFRAPCPFEMLKTAVCG